jgi:HAD superfamily hydrolase (TIGR01662 family)
MTKHYACVLFDWDGTLAQTLSILLDSYKTAMSNRGVHLPDAVIAQGFGAFPEYMKQWGVPHIDETIEEADALTAHSLPQAALYPGAQATLKSLHEQGKKLGLITTSSRQYVQPILEKYGIYRFFGITLMGSEIKRHKPDPESLRQAMQQLGSSASETIMVGDSDKDLGAAHNAGIDSILFYPPEHHLFYKREYLERLQPTYGVDHLQAVLSIVE